MAKSEAQKQKKLARKRTKDLSRQREAARQKNRMESFAGQYEAACEGEILYSGLSPEFGNDTAIGSATVIRKVDAARVLMVRWLIDTALMGVKDVVTQSLPIGSMSKAREVFGEPGPGQMPPAPVADIKRLIELAIQYAAQYDFEPHWQYAKVASFLDDVDASTSTREFEFGVRGRATYIPGPFDSPEFISEMTTKLESRDDVDIDADATAAALLGDDDFSALDDPELDVDIDEDVVVETKPSV